MRHTIAALILATGLAGSLRADAPTSCACLGVGPAAACTCYGAPPALHPCAQPSDNGQYIGYYVGGGTSCGGEPRCRQEGTWGWDYSGCLFQRHVILWWTHGKLYQGGTGAYKTDGPKPLEKLHRDP